MPLAEMVVLLDEQHTPIGSLPKLEIHGPDTPLHLAFSCYLQDATGRILVTRRALTKQTWPGVWTNSFCGHPAPGESLTAAVHRRAQQELGADVSNVRAALPQFRYRATDASGVVENEFCPVFVAELAGELTPDPAEVSEWAWLTPTALAGAVAAAPFVFSPWLQAQLPELGSMLGPTTEPPA